MVFTARPSPATSDARSPLPGFHARTLDGRDPDLIPHWNACLTRSPRDCRYYTHGWYTAWLATYGARTHFTGQGHVVVATTDAGQTVGLLPLAHARKRGLRVLSFAGYYQPVRSLVVDAEVAEDAGAALASAVLDQPLSWDLFRVGPIVLDTPGHRGFLEGLRRHAHFVDVKRLEGAVVCRGLPADFDEYQAKVMGRSFVKEVQKKVRRLSRDGNYTVRHYHNPSGEELETVLRECRLVEGRSWLVDAEDGKPRFATEVDFEFWRQFASTGLAPDGGLDAWVLHFANRPISYQLAVTAGGIRYGISSQYDRDYHQYSPGSVIIYHLFEEACNSGVQAVDLNTGDTEYKGRWGAVEEGGRVEAVVFPRGLKGRCLAALYKTVKRLRPNWLKPPV